MPPDALMRKTPTAPPPNETEFVEADDTERLLMLSDAYLNQSGVVRKEHSQTDGLREWKARVLKYYQAQEDTEIREDVPMDSR